MNGLPVRSCSIPVSAAGGAKITTIESLASGKTLHKVQKAWIDNDVPQCGYCQSGMIMAGFSALKSKPKTNYARHDAAHTNNYLNRTLRFGGETTHAPTKATPESHT